MLFLHGGVLDVNFPAELHQFAGERVALQDHFQVRQEPPNVAACTVDEEVKKRGQPLALVKLRRRKMDWQN